MEVHGDKYDYSLLKPVKNKLGKISYRCIKHDYVCEQSLHNHLQGKGCPICAKEKRRIGRLIAKDDFIKAVKNRGKLKDIENYDFDKVDFSFRDKLGRMEMFCKKHGRFLIRPYHFINGVGCQLCSGRKKTDEDVKKELKEIHPTMDFSNTLYSERDENGNIKFTCPKHGIKSMRYWNLINGECCDECARENSGLKLRLTNSEIIKRAKKHYGENTYDYSKLDTFNRSDGDKIVITCKKHGDFLTRIGNFSQGKSGCPICRGSRLELNIKNTLDKNNVKYEPQKTFDWLKYKSNLFLDFYLPDYNIAIECQGEQHFYPSDFFGGDEGFKEIVMRDKIKKQLCEEHGIKLIYYLDKKHKQGENDYISTRKIIDDL